MGREPNPVAEAVTDADRLKALQAVEAAIRAGYGGVMPDGNVVDRRLVSGAQPIEANVMFGMPDPKPV